MARSQAYAPRYRYIGCCVDLDGDAISAMLDAAREICLSDFTRMLDRQTWDDCKRRLGYSRLFRVENDWHVSFGRSVYQGRACVFVTHSAIEYVFTEVTAG